MVVDLGSVLSNYHVPCEQAHLKVARESDEEQSVPAGRSRLTASPLDLALAATPRAVVLQFSPALQLEPARRLTITRQKSQFHNVLVNSHHETYLQDTFMSCLSGMASNPGLG